MVANEVQYRTLDGGDAISKNGYTFGGGIPFPFVGVPDVRHLSCAQGWVMTGMGVRYDTRKGKITRLKIYCRALSYTPLY